MPYHLLLDSAGEAKLGQPPDRHDPARHRPLLRRQGLAAGHPRAGPARREDPQAEDHRRARAQAAVAAAVHEGPGARPADDDRGVPDLRPPPRAAHRRHRAPGLGRARRRRRRALRGRAGRAARHRPRHLSLRHLVEPGRGRRLRRHRRRAARHRRGLGHRQGLRHARRRRPVPDRARRRARRRDLRERGGEFGTTTGRAAPHRLDRPRRAALRGADQLADGARRSPSSTCSPASRPSSVGTRYRGAEGAEFDDFPYHQSVLHHATAEYDGAARLGGGHHRVPQRSRSCPPTRAPTSSSIEDHVGVPIALVGVGPGREQVIWTEAGRQSAVAEAPASRA